MFKTFVLAGALGALVAAAPVGTSAAAHAVQAANQATPEDAAPFLGEWTLALQGPDGPGTFGLSVKVEKTRVAGEIRADSMPTHAITDVSRYKDTLVLSYTFDYEGMPVDAVVTLTPTEQGTVGARIDFAGGAYVMSGAATKKDASTK